MTTEERDLIPDPKANGLLIFNATNNRFEQAGRDKSEDNKLYIDNTDTINPLIYGDFTSNKVTINDD